MVAWQIGNGFLLLQFLFYFIYYCEEFPVAHKIEKQHNLCVGYRVAAAFCSKWSASKSRKQPRPTCM